VRMDSDSSDSSDNDLFEFLDFLHEFGTANDRRHESETESETENETEGNVNYPINRLVPFYERRKDIFDMFNDEQIVRTFRFDKQAILYITGLVEDSLPKRYTKCKRRLLPVDQVLLALQFFATGTIQSVVANVLRVSQRSVGRAIHAVANAFCCIAHNHMSVDSTNLVPLQRDFAEIANMPGVFGCIDGTHIRISRPHEWEASFVNRKGYHSMNVQGVCDAKYKFIDITVK